MIILSPCFADDSRVASIFAFCYIGSDLAVQAAKDGGAACVVQA